MTASDSTRLDAVILGYNGVIGVQPTAAQWTALAGLAGWPEDEVADFQKEFWQRREAYDQGTITTNIFWHPLLRPATLLGSRQMARPPAHNAVSHSAAHAGLRAPSAPPS